MFKTFSIQHSTFSIFLIACCLTSTSLQAQVVRLPAVESPSAYPPGQLVSHPDSSAEILQAPAEGDVAPAMPAADPPQLPPGARNGFFQKVLADATWLAPGGDRSMGQTDLQLQGVFALPCPKPTSPLVLTPGFAVHYLDGPEEADLPPQLHEGYTQFRWLSQVAPQLGLDLAVTPGWYSDFNQSSSEAFRLTAHAASAWTWTDTAKIVFGAAYLDRPDAEVIPIGGLIWTPTLLAGMVVIS